MILVLKLKSFVKNASYLEIIRNINSQFSINNNSITIGKTFQRHDNSTATCPRHLTRADVSKGPVGFTAKNTVSNRDKRSDRNPKRANEGVKRGSSWYELSRETSSPRRESETSECRDRRLENETIEGLD